MEQSWSDLRIHVASSLRTAGLDLVQPFCVGWYNEVVEPAYRLPDFGRGDALGLLIANGRSLWPRFLDALRAEPARLDDSNPLDRYVTERLSAALRVIAVRHETRFAHEPEPRRIAVQRLAHLAGLAWLAPSHLSIHPVYGPWIALRAVVVCDIGGPEGPPGEPLDPCGQCVARCLPLFTRAVATVGTTAAHDAMVGYWREWLAFREACSLGREHRYFDDQIAYHYTRDRTVLVDALRRSQPPRP